MLFLYTLINYMYFYLVYIRLAAVDKADILRSGDSVIVPFCIVEGLLTFSLIILGTNIITQGIWYTFNQYVNKLNVNAKWLGQLISNLVTALQLTYWQTTQLGVSAHLFC